MKTLKLLQEKRLGPLFWTQFFGAFNDNLLKNALIIFFTFKAKPPPWLSERALVPLCAAVFITPFFLFSALFGQIADKFEKSRLIRIIKWLEIFIMLLAGLGFLQQNLGLLMLSLFLMGTHSAFFGPLKYSILPQHLPESELVAANGLIEMGTFLAILLGTILGGMLVGISPACVAAGLLVFAALGIAASRAVPPAPSLDPAMPLRWNLPAESLRLHRFARKNHTVYLSILGISWFWFFGATFLTLLPTYTKITLSGGPHTVTALLTVFSVGVGAGSLLCERLSGKRVELGLVPLGSIGMTLFSLDLFFAGTPQSGWAIARIGVDLFLIALFSGFFIVPLNALVQQRSEPSHCSRVIAANNILNALFMVISAVWMMFLYRIGWKDPQIFLLIALLNAAVATFIYKLIPEFLMRFIIWMLVHTVYDLKATGLENIPETGAALVVCNHVSFVDALVISAVSRRPIRFVMDHQIFKTPVISYVFKKGRCIPIAPYKEDPDALEKAFEEISRALAQGDLVGIFPEGKLTADGEMNVFRPGVERILKNNPVPVVPMALQGLWGSWFSRKDGKAMHGIPKQWSLPIALQIAAPMRPEQSSAANLQARVAELRGEYP